MDNKEAFHFTYSAAQQQEVEAIRKKYLPREEDKLEQLRKLHAIPSQRAQTAALVVGIVGALSLGTGMSLIMTDLAAALGLSAAAALITGLVCGIAGIVLVALAYPLYNIILKKERSRIAPEILRLSDELLN